MRSINDYLDKIKPLQKAELQRIRRIVRDTVPESEEYIGSGLPEFKYKNNTLLCFAGYKKHMSLFVATGPIKALQDKLSDFVVSNGSIQFTLEKLLPEILIKEILNERMTEINKSTEEA